MKNASGEQFRSLHLDFEQRPPEDFLERHVKRTVDGVAFEASDWCSALTSLSMLLFCVVCMVVLAPLGAVATFQEVDHVGFLLFILGCWAFMGMLSVTLVGHHGFVAKTPLSTEWNNTSRTVRHTYIGGFRHCELVIRYDDVLGFDLRREDGDGLTSHHLRMAIQFGASVEESSQWVWSRATPRRRQFIVSPSGFWKSIFELRFAGPSQPRDHAEFELTPRGFPALADLERARDVLVQATGLPAKVVSLPWDLPLRPNV